MPQLVRQERLQIVRALPLRGRQRSRSGECSLSVVAEERVRIENLPCELRGRPGANRRAWRICRDHSGERQHAGGKRHA